MKNLFKKLVFFFAGALLITACKEAYNPQVADSQNSYLVIEGILNNGGPTSIRLNRTRPLNETIEKPELKAVVSIETERNQSFLLTEKGSGEYTIQLSLNSVEKYRLHIKTTNGKEYLSDFVPVMSTPPVDEVTWKKNNEGILISVNTHDPQNNTRYYRWGFEETWVRQIDIRSYFEYINGTVKARKTPTPTICYDNRTVDPLALASTIKLTNDVVYQAPVNLISLGSEKLITKYSILVKQYALEQKAYEYWQAMKKNTEQLGSIFDPQPSYMYGNIRSANDPEEMVLGYFGACNVTEKRIFITSTEANWHIAPPPPPPLGPRPPYPPCEIRNVTDINPAKHPALFSQYFGNQKGQLGWIPLTEIWDYDIKNDVYIFIGYTAVEKLYCADCGPNYLKPGWWQ